MPEESDKTIEKYEHSNDELRQRLWKAGKKLQSKIDEIGEKEEEIKTAGDLILILKRRLKELGDELGNDDEEGPIIADQEHFK